MTTSTLLTNMNNDQLDTLKDNYAYHIVDGMDMNHSVTFAVETIAQTWKTWTRKMSRERFLTTMMKKL